MKMLKEFMREIENLIEENEKLIEENEGLNLLISIYEEKVKRIDRGLTVHRLEVAKPGASVWSQGSRRFAKRGDGRWTDMFGPGLYDSEQVLSIVPDGKLTHE